MEKVFNVKEKSLHLFFGIDEKSSNVRIDISPYYLLKDEIIIPFKPEIVESEEVVFVLEDKAVYSGAALQSVYKYSVEQYDSLQMKLVLVSHTIRNVERTSVEEKKS